MTSDTSASDHGECAVTAIITVALLLSGLGLLAQASFKSADTLTDAWKRMEVRAGEIARTAIAVLWTTDSNPEWDITISNSGEAQLLDLPSWDLIVFYTLPNGTQEQRWLPYTEASSPSDNQWTVTGIYLDAATLDPEIFHPDILDPGEEMVIRLRLNPPPKPGVNHLAVIGTPNGISTSTIF